MEPRWLNNPRYQKAVQKMARLDPTRNAILDTVIADEAFADAEMRNRLAMMRLAAQKTGHAQNLELGEKRLAYDKNRADARYSLAEDTMDMNKKDAALSQNLGWGNIALGGVQGLANLKNQKRQTELYRGLASLYNK